MPSSKVLRKIRFPQPPGQAILAIPAKALPFVRAFAQFLVIPSGSLAPSLRARARGVCFADLLRQTNGSAILEFAITVPLLVVFVVGIYDFGGAFNQKQKIEQAAQEGAIVAAAQPTSDIDASNSSPVSLQPVANAVFNSLVGSGVIAQGACTVPPSSVQQGNALTWQYTVSGCDSYSDSLLITINRGWACTSGTPCSTSPPASLGSTVTVNYPYHWRFNSVIQLLIPGASYAAVTNLQETATAHNQT
jgi:TadE-like protein